MGHVRPRPIRGSFVVVRGDDWRSVGVPVGRIFLGKKMTETIFRHLYELDNILFELPMWPYIWQVIEMLSQTELDHFILCATVA